MYFNLDENGYIMEMGIDQPNYQFEADLPFSMGEINWWKSTGKDEEGNYQWQKQTLEEYNARFGLTE